MDQTLIENSAGDGSGSIGDSANNFLNGLFDNVQTIADAGAQALAQHIAQSGTAQSSNPAAAPKIPVGQNANGSTMATVAAPNQTANLMKYAVGGVLLLLAVVVVVKVAK